MLTNRDKLELHTIRGTAIQCGRQYGQRWSTGMLGFYYQELRPDKQKLAYARRCWEHVEKACPHSAQFMRGMARGSGLTVDQVALLALHEENHHIRPHCTAFAATGADTRGGKTLVAMNWDWSAQLYPWAGLLRLDARGSPRALTYHYPGLWASAGVNQHGLSFMWTGAGHMPVLEPVVGLPTYVLIAEILRRRSVPAVLRWLDSITHAGSFIFFIGDAEGRIAVIEGMPGRLAMDRSADALIRANHYNCADIVGASKQRVLRVGSKTTAYRAKRMAQLVGDNVPGLTVKAGRQILTDRDGPGPWLHQFPYGTGRFTSGGMTIDSLLAVSEDRALYTCRGGWEHGPWQRVKV